MKLRCEVLSVSTNGDSLTVAYQATKVAGADWRPMLCGSISVPVTTASQRTYYVGRVFTVKLEPLP